MPRRSKLSSKQSRPEYLSSAEGLELLEFIQGVFAHVGDVSCSLSYDIFYELYHRYVYVGSDDSYSISYLTERHPELPIISLKCSVVRSGHSGYCSDPENDDYSLPHDSTVYIALPAGLNGEIDDISAEQIYTHEHAQCYCGGQCESWTVVSIVKI